MSGRQRDDKFRSLGEIASHLVKVGIVWSGNARFKRNGHRATSRQRFTDAFAMPGVQLFSLQKGAPAAELEGHPGVIDLAPMLDDPG